MLMKIHLRKILTEVTNLAKDWIRSTRPVTKKKMKMKNNPMKKMAPVMRKIKR